MSKVLVAMSGGVDSSVAAALLKEQGYECLGVTMVLACATKAADRGCCSQDSINDAQKVAKALDIAHYTLNFKQEFQKFVIDNFIVEYKNGRTPNPCVRCNQFIKFDYLLKKAEELGCDFIATGHYVRILPLTPFSPSPLPRGKGIGDRGFKLLKGIDTKKDQSYVLYTLNQETLAKVLFPLGDMTKEEVREKAKALGLPVHDKAESQEICFVEDDDYASFIRQKCPDAVKPGKIVDINGQVVGQHEGVAFFTLGQRKGIGAHKGQPKYVVKIDVTSNTVVIGDEKDLLGKELIAHDLTFVSGQVPSEPLKVTAKIRYNASEAQATLDPSGKVVFEKPQRAITQGQSVVFYDGEEVVGGGIIA